MSAEKHIAELTPEMLEILQAAGHEPPKYTPDPSLGSGPHRFWLLRVPEKACYTQKSEAFKRQNNLPIGLKEGMWQVSQTGNQPTGDPIFAEAFHFTANNVVFALGRQTRTTADQIRDAVHGTRPADMRRLEAEQPRTKTSFPPRSEKKIGPSAPKPRKEKGPPKEVFHYEQTQQYLLVRDAKRKAAEDLTALGNRIRQRLKLEPKAKLFDDNGIVVDIITGADRESLEKAAADSKTARDLYDTQIATMPKRPGPLPPKKLVAGGSSEAPTTSGATPPTGTGAGAIATAGESSQRNPLTQKPTARNNGLQDT